MAVVCGGSGVDGVENNKHQNSKITGYRLQVALTGQSDADLTHIYLVG